jgi:metal-dependent hydrolase (beta-lactamase superfamily II)
LSSSSLAPAAALGDAAAAAAAVQKINSKYIIPYHCTGWKAMNKIIDFMPNKFIQSAVCTTFTFNYRYRYYRVPIHII